MTDEEMVNKLLNNHDIGIVITTGQEGLGVGCKGSVAEFICLFGILVVKLHIMSGCSYEELGEMLNTAVETAKNDKVVMQYLNP
jgi:hypothetical protein